MIFLIALALELDFEVKSPLCPSRYSLLHKLLDVTEIFALKSRDLEINLNLVLFVHSWHSLFNTNLFWRLHFDCAQWTEPKAEVGQFLSLLLNLNLNFSLKLNPHDVHHYTAYCISY